MDPSLAIRSTITAIRSGALAKARIPLPSITLRLEPIDPRVYQPYRDIDEKAARLRALLAHGMLTSVSRRTHAEESS